MKKKKSSEKPPASNKVRMKKLAAITEPIAPKGKKGYATGDRVKSTTDIGPVASGTEGTVTQGFPESSWVLFDGTSEDRLVVNQDLEPA
jgi:hypothetical protein